MSWRFEDLKVDAWLLALVDPHTTVAHLAIGHTTLGVDYLDRYEQDHLIWYVINGAVDVAVDSGQGRAYSGQALWVNPGHGHSEWHRARSPIIYFRLRLERSGHILRLNRDLLITKTAWNLRADLEEIIVETQDQRPYRKKYIRFLLAKFFTSLLRQQKSSQNRQGPTKRKLSYDQINTLLAYMREHMSESVKPGDLARRMERSLGYMTPLFKASLGLAPRQWIVQQKMQHAANLLRDTDDAILEIAAGVGYDDANLFSRQFRKVMGHAPRNFRRQIRHS